MTGDGSQIPTFRVLDGAGKLLEGADAPEVYFFAELAELAQRSLD